MVRSRQFGLLAMTLGASAALAGCGVSTLTSGLSNGMFGAQKKQEQRVAAVTREDLLLAAKANYGPGGVNVGQVAHGCPAFEIRSDGHETTVYEPGRAGDGLSVMHKGEITRTARECTIEPGRVTVRFGFSGRVLLGPRGQAGRVMLPVVVVVEDGNRAPVRQDTLQVGVDLTLESPIGYFSEVQTVTFDIPEGSRPGEFRLNVSFPPQLPVSAG